MFKKKLKAALRKAGLNEGLADFITVNSEAEIKTIIANLKESQDDDDEGDDEPNIEDIIGSPEFENYVNTIGFDKLIEKSKMLKSGHDRKVSEGVNSFKKRALKGMKFKTKEEDDDDDEGDEDDEDVDTSKGDSAVLKVLKKMEARLEAMEKEKEARTKQDDVLEKLKKSSLPEKLQKRWAARIDLENDIDEQIEDLEKEFEDLKSEGIASGSYEFGHRQPNTKKGELSKTEKKEFAGLAKSL